MDTEFIETEFNAGVLTIILNRPEKLNSFIEPMAKEILLALINAGEDPETRCLLLTGAGRAFCAGQDLPEVVERSDDDDYVLGDTVRNSYNPIIKAIRQISKPVVCAVNGTAAGAGANIAFACDITIASDEAFFIQSFSKIGLIPDSGGTFFLPRLIGLQQTNMLYMLDEKIPARKAVELGLICKAFPSDILRGEARAICQKLAELPTKGFGLYKRAINRSFMNNLDEHLEMEADLQTMAGKSYDYKEGVQAFLEKRKPKFEGR